MAAIDDDDRPKKKIAHEIGQDLSLLSVEELAPAGPAYARRDQTARSRYGAKARQAGGGRSVFQEIARDPKSAPRAKIKHWPQSGNLSLSFLDHYWARPSSWTLSGSCPLCLTPPCYHLRAAGNGGSFFCPISGQLTVTGGRSSSSRGNYVARLGWTARWQPRDCYACNGAENGLGSA